MAISREQASRFVTDRSSLHDAMIRNGYLLPQKGQSICTSEFMRKVRGGSLWCPKHSNAIHPPRLVTHPPRRILADAIKAAAV